MKVASVVASGLVIGLALTGCGSSTSGSGSSGGSSNGSSAGLNGSSNGIESKSVTEIVAATQAAAKAQSSVHVAGAGTSGGTAVGIDMSLVKGKGGSGSITTDGSKFQIVTTTSTLYFKADKAFWTKSGGSALATLVGDRWVKVPIGNKDFADLASMGDFTSAVGSFLSSTGTPSKGATKTIDGQPALSLVDSDGSLLWIATTGDPLPLRIENTASKGAAAGSGGALVFSQWNAAPAPTVPAAADTVDLSKLASGG